MEHRERVRRTFNFQPVDQFACDIAESRIWPEIIDYFRDTHGINGEDEIRNFLDLDFRWITMRYNGPDLGPPDMGAAVHGNLQAVSTRWALTCRYGEEAGRVSMEELRSYGDALHRRPLADASSVADVESYPSVDPAWWQPPDFQAIRSRWPRHSLVLVPGWMPLFCGACDSFGMEEACVKMIAEPEVFEAFVSRQNEVFMDVLKRALDAAEGFCDICWLADDYAGQESMLIDPDLWRKLVKPYLAEQVRMVRERGMFVLFHLCGAIRPILGDLIDIGMNGMQVFQTTATGMDAASIARDFGGKLVFSGGIDCQQLLTFGTPEQVRAEVRKNIKAFSQCGGYIVSSTHHGINIRCDNLVAMCRAARELRATDIECATV
ncbi:MAG: hypothetical protein HYX78_02235 [Armatimonadetes bacterium]|nr:hypothetical protein [Armatimonadota bacterium]